DQEVNSEKVDAGSNEDETTTGEEQGINQEKKVPSEQNKKEDLKKSPVQRGNTKLARIAKRKSGGLRSRKKRFKVRTVSAVVGVRGTEFVVAAAGDSTNVLTVTGEVTLASAELPGYEVVLPKSNVSRVREGSAPSEPVAVPPAEQQQIVESGSTEGFQEVEFGPAQALDAVQKSESGQPEESRDLKGGEEISILDQLETLDEIQQMIDSAENAINLSQTRILILKTNITPR
ncbi:MAG: FecR domain-containing protein, partial [SAR324 cluster bacterium]|nr:FecR domain-containing protein [SAR324 cluster bacterium]